jgi:arginine-tRNA-protein transferase
MAYKASFRPMERLGRDGWRRMDAPEPELIVDRPLPARAPRRILVDA